MTNKQLIILEAENYWKPIIQSQSKSDRYLTLFIARRDVEALKQLEEETIKQSLENEEIEFKYKDKIMIGKLRKGITLKNTTTRKVIDWEKVEQFAIENSKTLHWIENITNHIEENKSTSNISKTQISYSKILNQSKIENELWFQENLELFSKDETSEYTHTSSDMITFKEKK